MTQAESVRLALGVEDRGPGIPRSERDKVFEPFYRIEASRSPDTGGVGLAVVHSIASTAATSPLPPATATAFPLGSNCQAGR